MAVNFCFHQLDFSSSILNTVYLKNYEKLLIEKIYILYNFRGIGLQNYKLKLNYDIFYKIKISLKYHKFYLKQIEIRYFRKNLLSPFLHS